MLDRQTDHSIRELLYSVKHSLLQHHKTWVREKFEKRLHKRLKNKNFSILCSNCIGGFIYHRLGMEFLSPTINLKINSKEFIKFVRNLKYYLNQKIVFIDSDKDYPVGMIDDIRLDFLHYTTREEADEAWERRKKRVDFNNIYCIVYDRGILNHDDYKQIDKMLKEKTVCKNFIVLADNENNKYPFIKRIIKHEDPVYFDKDKYGIMTYEKQWDFVGWLNEN